MFITTLFKIAKIWKEPRCPTTDEWNKKTCYLYAMEFYSAIKNEILSFSGKCRELENIILSEISQLLKEKDHMFLSYVKDSSNTNTSIIKYAYK
jgi:hypothetical protein